MAMFLTLATTGFASNFSPRKTLIWVLNINALAKQPKFLDFLENLFTVVRPVLVGSNIVSKLGRLSAELWP